MAGGCAPISRSHLCCHGKGRVVGSVKLVAPLERSRACCYRGTHHFSCPLLRRLHFCRTHICAGDAG